MTVVLFEALQSNGNASQLMDMKGLCCPWMLITFIHVHEQMQSNIIRCM
jgi:hypothetical protein